MNCNKDWNSIDKVDSKIIEESKARWDSIAKPIEGLGKMEELITRIAGSGNC